MDKNNTDRKVVRVEVIKVEILSSESERLDVFLIKSFPEYSRSYFQKLIDDGFVQVNEKLVNKSFTMKLDDEIRISFPEPRSYAVKPQEVSFEIIDIQDDFLIINKPAGLTVHHTKEYSPDPTLVSGLLYRFKEFKDFSDQDRPGIVHRLDKDTSGLLIVARNERAHIEFSRLFKQRLIKKNYIAVVNGHPSSEGEIDFPIGRHPTVRTKMSHVSYSGRPALTRYSVLQYYKDCSLVQVMLVTGRTHQIRVHFAAMGYGLLGDAMYGIKSKIINRQALHSWKLSFEYKGKHFDYSCIVPLDFKKLLHALKEKRIV